ncbi:Holliday junction resolvase RuvX [Candidatus Methylacidithermus pantelleriae]|uniref:Putative pre-16S rRNA nuclease n=1 Tax=Candidatus Methylacidithermus pantelleriae TaxID=2744239 RepID=A0A8J2BUA2_9BACT|nr:Holliday junction resolvase RuvX [Candidatus Methylacidithermus pantelleriae]CAF0700963.1 Putative pre-16S rRNA nuclease [Candidatus Methylacidithermus pantelleriae]
MRILALDYGSKRVGLAVSDPTGTLATPLGTLPAEPFSKFLEELRQITARYEVGVILIGWPKNMNGTVGPSAHRVLLFASRIQAELSLRVELRDERWTTRQALRQLQALYPGKSRSQKRRKKKDGVSAAIILQTFLEERQAQNCGENRL